MAKFNNVNAELARRGLTAGDLAEYMGLSKQSIYNKINGKCAVDTDDMQAVKRFFNEEHGGDLTMDYLFAVDN